VKITPFQHYTIPARPTDPTTVVSPCHSSLLLMFLSVLSLPQCFPSAQSLQIPDHQQDHHKQPNTVVHLFLIKLRRRDRKDNQVAEKQIK